VAKGPAGQPAEWDAIITKMEPNRVLSWESLPDSQVYNAGRVRFVDVDGGTRVDVFLSYSPPGGMVGHAVASLLGTNPKQAMNEDLLRLKSLIEKGRTTTEGEQVTHDQAYGFGQERESASAFDAQSYRESRTESGTESGMPGGGQGRTDRVGQTGVYPASGPMPEGDAEVQGMASWGQGERGAAGYEDSGSSELPMAQEPDLDDLEIGERHEDEEK
jgi:hypothetical protein